MSKVPSKPTRTSDVTAPNKQTIPPTRRGQSGQFGESIGGLADPVGSVEGPTLASGASSKPKPRPIGIPNQVTEGRMKSVEAPTMVSGNNGPTISRPDPNAVVVVSPYR
jgi:hypothetical protein